MTSAAAKRGKARLEAFRASRKTSTAPKNGAGDALTPVTTTSTTTTMPVTTTTITAISSSSSLPVVSTKDTKMDDARTTRLDVGVEVREVAEAQMTTRLLIDEYKDDGAMRMSKIDSDSAIMEMGSDGIGGGEVSNAYSMLADDYASVVETPRSTAETEEEVEKDGNLTTSSDRAREQYERVMRAIGVESDSLYGRGVVDGRDEEEEEEDSAHGEDYNQKDAAEPLAPNSELDAIIDCVRTDGAIGNVVARMVKDDQSEIAMLQDVIDEMTTEKLGLMRGLQKSQAMVDELAAENDSLTQRFNETRAQLSQTQRELDELWMKYQERGPQSDTLADDGDSSARVRSLAAEVVGLEERLQEFEETKEANTRLDQEAKRANQRAVDAEIMLEATRAEQAMFKEKIVGSELMKTLESLAGDDGAFLCAWLKKSSFAAEKEAQAKAKMVKESHDSTAVDEEQLKILSSINDLLGELEIEKKSLARQLNSANEVKQQLLERNGLLESQLAKTLSRLAEEGLDGEEDWSDEEVVKPRRGLFSLFRRRQE